MTYEEPPPDAYGRVTNPGRFRVLHGAAERVIDDLAKRYDIQVREGQASDDPFIVAGDVERVVFLEPSRPDAAAVSIGFTSYPGLIVRFGRWHAEVFPRCGCDACDEDPDWLIEELRKRLDATTSGGFSETVTGGFRPGRMATFVGAKSTSSGWVRLSRAEVGRPERIDWAPWPPAPAADP